MQTVEHPSLDSEELSFMADVPHLLKNLRSALLRNAIQLPSFIVEKYCLPTEQVMD